MLLDSPFRPGSRVYFYCCTILWLSILVMDVQLVIGGSAMDSRKRFGGTALSSRRRSTGLCIDPDDPKVVEARDVFEDLLPYRKKQFEPLTDEVIQSLLLYLTSVSETINKQLPKDELYATIWQDMVGDYLHAYLLPVSKYCFYSGNVSYRSVRSVLSYYKRIKHSLDTDGTGWSKPELDTVNAHSKIRPLPVGSLTRSNCSELIANDSSEVALPKTEELDDDEFPPAIISLWVPFQSRAVYDPRSRTSLSVLRIYYESVLKCVPKSKRKHFANQFAKWIDKQLVDHLMDEHFYPGLEAILQIRHALGSEKQISKKEIAATVDHGTNSEKKGLFDNLFTAMVASDVQEEYEDEDYADEDDRPAMYYVKVVCIAIGCSLLIVILIAIIVKMCKNRKIMKRKTKIVDSRTLNRRKFGNKKDDQSDEDILLLLEKNGKKISPSSSGNSWKHVKKTKPSTSKQLPPFSETEDDDEEFEPFQSKKLSAELVPLLSKESNQNKKKKSRCGKGCICMNCLRQPTQGGAGHDRRSSSSYQLVKETNKTPPESKVDKSPAIIEPTSAMRNVRGGNPTARKYPSEAWNNT